MADSGDGKINWRGLEVTPEAMASASLTLTGQLLAFLTRRGRLSKAEVAEIFGAAKAAHKMGGQVDQPSPDWEAQTSAVLQLIQNDVIR